MVMKLIASNFIDLFRMSNKIGLYYEDKELRNDFLTRLYLSYKSEVFIQDISSVEDQELQQKSLSIQNNTFSFVLVTQHHRLQKPEFNIFLFEVGEELDHLFYEKIDEKLIVPERLFIIICKHSLKIRQSTVTAFRNSLLQALSTNLGLQVDPKMVLQICLNEPKDPIPALLTEKLDQWAKTNRQNQSSLGKEGSINKIELSSIDYRNQLTSQLTQIIQSYKISKTDLCLDQLLNGNIEDAILMAKKDYRKQFKEEIAKCQLLEKYLNTKMSEKQTVETSSFEKLKQNASEKLLQIFGHYQIKNKQQCIQNLLENNLDDALLQVKKSERLAFKKDVQACKELIDFLRHLKTPCDNPHDNTQELLKTKAELEVKGILQACGASDVEQFCQLIFEGKLDQVLCQVPKKHRSKLQQECNKCKALSEYMSFLNKKTQDPRSQLITLLETVLTKYQAKDVKGLIEDILKGDLELAAGKLPAKMQKSFKQELKNCQQVKKYYQQCLKGLAQAQIDDLLSKYNLGDPEELIPLLLDGNIDEALKQIPKRKKESFRQDYQKCFKLAQYLVFVSDISATNEGEIQSAKVLREKAKKALQSLITKYKVKKEDQCIEDLLNNNMEDAILFVNKNSREKFMQEISKCKQYLLLQQQLQKKTQDNSLQVMKDKAINSLKKIFEKYSIKNDEQCLEDLLNNKVKDASMYTKKTQRSNFISDIESNKQLIQYWKGQSNTNNDSKLYQSASQAVINILQNHEVSQLQSCLEYILKGNITAALEQVHPRRRPTCQKDLKNCEQLTAYQKILKNNQVDKEEQAKKSLREICLSFNAKQIDECVLQILAGQTDKAVFYVSKVNRQSFLKAINTCQPYQRFIKNTSEGNQGDKVSNVKQALSKILKEFQVEKIDQCMEEILRGDLKEAEFNVKKPFRVEFKRQIQESSVFKQYISSLKPQNKQQIVQRKAKDSIRSILKKYVDDNVQEFLELFFNSKVKEVLQDLRPSKVAIFQKEVNDSKDYQDYLQSIKANGSKQQIQAMKAMLSKLNLSQSNLAKYLKDLQQCKLYDLKEEVGTTTFYQILGKLLQQFNYQPFLVQNSQNNIGHLSYFYFLISNQEQLDQVITKLVNYVESNANILDGGLWLDQLVSLQPELVIMKIESQNILLKEAGLTNNKAKSLIEILDLIKRLCLIGVYKNLLNFLQGSLKDHQLGLEGVTQKKHEKKLKLLEIKDKFAKEQCQKEIIHLQKIIKVSEKIKDYEKMLGITSCMDLAFQYTNKLHEQKILINQISQIVLKFSQAAKLNLSEKNQQDYFTNKKLEIGYRIYSKFFSLYKQEVDALMVEIIFQENSYKVFLNNQLDYDILNTRISKQIGKNISQFITELIYDDRTFILSKNPGQLFQKPKTIKCFKKIQINLQFKEVVSKIYISKHIKPQSLKIIVHQSQNSTTKMLLDNICLFGVFGDSSQLEITQEIDIIEMKKLEPLKFLKVILKVSINVYYEVECFRFVLQEDESVEQLKRLILEKSKVPINSQSLFYVKENEQQLVFSQTFQQISPDSCNLTFILISKMNLEHYGFHQNYRLTFEDYSEFFVQKEDDLQNMVDSCQLNKEQEKNFFDQLIKFLYSAIKRRFPFSHVTDEVKKLLVSKNSQQIWSGADFSNSFLIYYILYNADQKLRIQMMNILRDYVPLPLYFREFENINQIKNRWIINHQLIWLLHSGLCITSIGLHTEKMKTQKGKTFLNNQIFYTKFEKARAKHQISSGCPQIMLKVIGSTKIVNIIDIPSETPDNIVKQILGVTDLLIIHSWRGRKDTEKFIEETKKTFGINNLVVFLRDCNSKEQTNYKVNQARFQSNCFLELHNLEENAIYNQQLTFMPKLREKVWELSDSCHKKSLQQTKCIYKMFNNMMFENFNAKIEKLLNNFLNMKAVFENYEKIKDLKKRNTNASLQEANTIKDSVVKNKVAHQFEQILRFINQNKKYSEFLMLRFRQKLKEKKSKQEKKYYAIASYQKKIGLLPQDNKQELNSLIDKACNQINKLEGISINKKETKEEMEEELSRVYKYFDNEIKSKFFTIQLAWRQLQYLTTLSSQVMLDNDYFIDFLIDIKRKEIANSQPFEILDGDLLEMPKKIMKKVFEGINERVAVITILGPQSSGKSTLLNFLFGCDFGTSEGRCTKGAYGTYFKFSNIMPANCDGIFLIDTEGLFAQVNKKDQARRKEFDAKLVLFCLAVSDFVFFNTKGNLDATSTKILTSSLERFAALTQQNIESPEIFLILNQNNSSDITTSYADINKLKDIFKVQNSNSLSQAYNTTEFAKSNIKMLGQNDIITKKEPKKQFLELTNRIQHSLIKKIQAKNTTKHISVVIDLMERVWETIQAFPDLGKTSSKKIQEIEKKIKQWRIEKIENLTLMRENVFNEFRQNKVNQKKCQDLFSQERELIQNEFRQTFLSDKQIDNMGDEQKLKIQLEEKKIQLAFQAVKYQLISQIKDLEKIRLAEKSKLEGGQYEKQAIRVVKRIQRETKKQLSVQERTKYFDNAFNKSLQMLQMIACPQQQLQSCFERTYQFYLSASSISVTHKSKNERTKNAGLPRPQWKCEEKMSNEQFSQLIREKVMRVMGKESNKYIEFKKDPPTKVLDEAARTDAKLEFFNMRNYFQKVEICNYYEISRLNFSNCLKLQLLKNLTSEMYAKKCKFQENIIKNIFESLNKCFERYGFKIQNYNNFQTYLVYQTKFFNFYISQPQLKIEIIQQKLFKKSKTKRRNNQQGFSTKGKNTNNYSSRSSHISYQGYTKTSTSYQSHLYGYNSHYQPSNYYASTNPHQTEPYYSSFQEDDDDSNGVSSEADYLQNTVDADLRSYLNIDLLEEKIKQLENSQFNSALSSFLGKCLKKIIKWDQIKKKIEKSKEFSSIKGQINIQLSKILNQDLDRVGLSVNCPDFYDLINKGKQTLTLSFQRTNEIKSFESQAELFKSFKLFEYFDEVKIRQNLKRSLTKSFGSSNSVQIGSYYEKTFQVKAEYRNHKELQTYISDNTQTVYVNLSTDTMKDFVFNELHNKGIISLLFKKIDAIIAKSANSLNLNTITGIFIDVNRQLTQFNNDLAQVSHKLTLLFTGYIHLYAVYLTWKHFSEKALKIANKPYSDFLQNREKQLSFFLKVTSDNDNQIVLGQAEKLINEVIQYCKEVIGDHKKKVNENEEKKFKREYPREVIQNKLDNQCFSTSSKPDDWIKYLMSPKEIVEEKYNQLIKLTVSTLGDKYKLCDKVLDIMKQFKQVISLLLDKLKSEGLTEDTIHTDIVGLVGKGIKQVSVSDNQVLEKINFLMMEFFLDVLVKDEKETYIEADFNIIIKNSHIKIQREPTPTFQSLIKKLKEQKQSITRFYLFVETLYSKLYEFVQVGGVKQLKFDETIKKMMVQTAEDQKDFVSRVAVKICQQMCPGCQRICGVEEPHTNKHQCRFGHQMRALGGVKLSNGDASVIRCQDIPLMSQLEFNGKKMTWSEFKQYWEKKQNGSWSFADLSTNKNKQIFIKAWDITGELICKKFQMKYVKSNALEAQKVSMAATSSAPTHYIFALDDSGSMMHQKWNDLMTSYRAAIQEIKKIADAEAKIKISVLIEGSNCILFQQNVTPNAVNINVPTRFGGNNFKDTFSKAYSLINKYVSGAKIKYIFMTDGGDSYPSAQVTQIKNLQNAYPNKIEYYGIQFQTNGDTMKLISKQLGGTNKISHNVTQLTTAYLEIINRKV